MALEIQRDLGRGQVIWFSMGLDTGMGHWCAGGRISYLWAGQWPARGVRSGPGSPWPHSEFAFSPSIFAHPGQTNQRLTLRASCAWEQLPTITQSKCALGECHISSPPRVHRELVPAWYDVYIRGFDLCFLVWFTGLCPAGAAKS